MTDANPNPTPPPPDDDILNELRELGQNLSGLLRSAWESEERRKLQTELETGLSELRTTLEDIANGPTGQTLRADLEDLGQRLRSGEVERTVRHEVAEALRSANEGLKKAASRHATAGEAPQTPEDPGQAQP